ncbi:MAG: hypothetical protein BGO67_01380 [Alphaproteobacteria bacterium 41-28]|nr:MAG: hypothetical protein BGO67_01380 [Alphaproteobacteria bacterium 41-28]
MLLAKHVPVKTGNEWGTFIGSSPSRAHKVGVAIQKLNLQTSPPIGGETLLIFTVYSIRGGQSQKFYL